MSSTDNQENEEIQGTQHSAVQSTAEATSLRASNLTIEEQASLTSGSDAWHLTPVKRVGLEGFMITDGPHGLRKAEGLIDHPNTVPATCFPPAAAMASSWNPEVARKTGVAMGEECRQEKVAVILGPGVNIKRNPLDGRSFEFWSEDPFLAGHEAIGIVEGVQSQGIGTSLKHFTANNQETDRFQIDERISERALREIYLPAFEHIVKTCEPWTMMCAYNKINGQYSSQNKWLLTDVLRKEWGFSSIIMSDWGAVHDRVASINAGLNLEMPPSNTDNQVVEAVRMGKISAGQLEKMAQGMIELIEKVRPAMQTDFTYDVDAHDEVAYEAALESIVLLKNENNLLPLEPAGEKTYAFIGEFARTPRYQGGGSSHINPTKVTSVLNALELENNAELNKRVEFAPGFTLDNEPQSQELTNQALEVAKRHDVAVLFLGLPDIDESEGYDRTTLAIPAKQVELLKQVSAVNKNTVVVLSNGSVVDLREVKEHAQAIVETWLMGQAGGRAVLDTLVGRSNPSGRLAETFPLRLQDVPNYETWPGGEHVTEYSDGIYVGYRHYDTVGAPVAFPFGFGLSYTSFAYENVKAELTSPRTARVELDVHNTGERDGADVVELFVCPPSDCAVDRPVHELKGFAKVFVKAGESKHVVIDLDERSFAYWSEARHDWHIQAGTYQLEVARSSRDVVVTLPVDIADDDKSMPLDEMNSLAEWIRNSHAYELYLKNGGKPFDVDVDDKAQEMFTAMPFANAVGFTQDSTSREAMYQAVEQLKAERQ